MFCGLSAWDLDDSGIGPACSAEADPSALHIERIVYGWWNNRMDQGTCYSDTPALTTSQTSAGFPSI